MHNSTSVLEDEAHKLLRAFEIQTDHLISARQPDLISIDKKERASWIVDFAVPVDLRVKLKERKKRDEYLDLAREMKKLWNMTMTTIPIVIGALDTIIKRLVQGLEDLQITGRGETLNYRIVQIGQNTKKSPGDLSWLAGTQTPVENHQLTLMLKTLKKKNNRYKQIIDTNKQKENLLNSVLCRFGWPQKKNWKKAKRKISTCTMLWNLENCGTWKRYWYQL